MVDPNPVVYIDEEPYRAVGREMTGAQLLTLAGYDADAVDLFAEGHRGQRIGPEQPVPVQDGSRFVTEPR